MANDPDPLGFLEDRSGKIAIFVKVRGRDTVKYMTIEEMHAWARFQAWQPRRGKRRSLDPETEYRILLVYLGARGALEDKTIAALRGRAKIDAVTDRIALAVQSFDRMLHPVSIPNAARDRVAAAVKAALDYTTGSPAVLARTVVLELLDAEGVTVSDDVILDLVRPRKLDQA